MTELGRLAPLFGWDWSGPFLSSRGGRLVWSLLSLGWTGGLLDLRLLLLTTLPALPPPTSGVSPPLTIVFISRMSMGVMALGSTTGWGL